MTLNQQLIAELQMEAASTRKLLSCIPEGKNDWKPHEKSMSLGRMAAHVAELHNWITVTMTTTELNLQTREYKPFMPDTNAELLAFMDEKVAAAVEALQNASTEEFTKPWTFRNGEHIIFTMPKAAVVRSFALNHLIHHRGQLSVYLRLLDVAIPGMYGPSADDNAAVAAAKAAN